MKVGMLSVLVGVIGMILIANLEVPLSTASLYLRLGDEVVALHFLLGDVGRGMQHRVCGKMSTTKSGILSASDARPPVPHCCCVFNRSHTLPRPVNG